MSEVYRYPDLGLDPGLGASLRDAWENNRQTSAMDDVNNAIIEEAVTTHLEQLSCGGQTTL